MVKSTEKTETSSERIETERKRAEQISQSDGKGTENESAANQAAQPTPQPAPPNIDASSMTKSYANFCQVHPGPEELAIDFGFSPSNILTPQTNAEIKVDHRVIVNYFMAKRLAGLLQGSIQRYEALFGVLETNIQKRVQQPPAPRLP